MQYIMKLFKLLKKEYLSNEIHTNNTDIKMIGRAIHCTLFPMYYEHSFQHRDTYTDSFEAVNKEI